MTTPIDLLILALEAGCQDMGLKVEFSGNHILEAAEDPGASGPAANNVQGLEEEMHYESSEQINTACLPDSNSRLVAKDNETTSANITVEQLKKIKKELTTIRSLTTRLRVAVDTFKVRDIGRINELLEKRMLQQPIGEGKSEARLDNDLQVESNTKEGDKQDLYEKSKRKRPNSLFEPIVRNRNKKKTRLEKNEIRNNREEILMEINGMVPIGSGRTLIPKNIYNNINWKSYTTSTRKLLSAVFTREVLATHSMTGNASPAFADKPAKRCLDPVKVADIVETVVSRCNVTDSLVRKAITSKCADENKMQRIKMKNLP